ncbi:MAG: hypothetical protein KDB90_16210 [Planctomycetes bacterium]|nr:hypothetical protein [Planctomycetota bacterium]
MTTTTFLKSPFLRTNSTTSSALRGLGLGLGCAIVVCLAVALSPFAASDRPALALLAVTLSFPLGVLASRRPKDLKDASSIGMTAAVSALALASTLTIAEPALWLRTASWCLAAGLLGASVASTVGGAGILATCGWLALNGLPFFYDRMPVLRETAEVWALQGCPWLGFSGDAFGGDPLRRPVLYLGQWTKLSSANSFSVLRASTLWLAAVPAFASLLVASLAGRAREQAEDSPELERSGA